MAAQPMTPAQYAEAPPTTGSHPSVTARIVEQMEDLTVLFDTGDAETFAPKSEPRLVLDALIRSATGAAERADRLAVHVVRRS